MTELSIRAAGNDDLDVIAHNNAAMALETEDKRLDMQTLTAGVRALLADARKGRYFIAEIDGKIVGQLMITLEWSDWRNGDFWWIQSVYIHPDYRRQGVYRQLYDHVYSLARNTQGICGLRLYVAKENRIAQQTYRALGMDAADYHLFEVDFVLGEH